MSSGTWIGADPSDADSLAIARSLLAAGDLAALPALWSSDPRVDLLVDMLALLIDALAHERTDEAIAALDGCSAAVAQQAIDLLLLSVFPDGDVGDLAELDDAALLCLALLAGVAGTPDDVADIIDDARGRRADPAFLRCARTIRDHSAPGLPGRGFTPKLIIWDLDDTLWHGTLADGDAPVLNETRAALLRAFNRHGIVSAICSKNDHDAARATLEAFGLWDEFVFPRIAFLPKGEVVRQLIADMRLRPVNVLFVDDNIRNLEEVAAAVPGIEVIDATSPDCDRLLERIRDEHAHVAKSRVADYRLLESRVGARRQSALTDDAFLRQSAIQATCTHRMDNLDFADRIEELINRSNQLNYTASRVEPGSLAELIMNVSDYDVFCAFVWDRYGYYGLVGAAIYQRQRRELVHFAFSCRIMHMGVEDYLLGALADRYGPIDIGGLAKPLPPQSSAAIERMAFEDPAVRARVLAAEAPRDWSRIGLRLMCDCQSGAFHHYSRFRDEIDFDNIPRVFTLPMMLDGRHADQHFPTHLVYTPATDYMDWRWQELMPLIDPAAYAEAADRFRDMVVSGNRKLLLFLPPEDAPEAMYDVIPTISAAGLIERNRSLNTLWRTMAARHPDQISCIDLGVFVGTDDMVTHAYHYVPSVLRRMSGMIDSWYAAGRATPPS